MSDPSSLKPNPQSLSDAQIDAAMERFKIRLKDKSSIWKGFENFHRICICIASFFLVLSISAMVVMRYILDTDLFGIEE